MFRFDSGIFRSDALLAPDVFHAFSTREGGVSTLPHTAKMNVAPDRGDDGKTVRENIRILLSLASGEEQPDEVLSRVVCGHQIHSATVRTVGRENGGEGIFRDPPLLADGYVTTEPGVYPLVRVADCVPVLLLARRADGSPVIGAVHAGWRGTAAGIAAEAVRVMRAAGALPDSFAAAIGPSIHSCCYEVGEDFLARVTELRGEDFSVRHITRRGGRLYADLQGMNRELLENAGVPASRIDVSENCTACRPDLFHSHRATGGKRGAMGAVIGIREK
ncbi:MAG: peptidoglycan editing factor PgeF [Clostridia bacterium]|nr:peptidoglycan editing factor PgeF [Clostridia bacterium]